jgi:hypothetical protein
VSSENNNSISIVRIGLIGTIPTNSSLFFQKMQKELIVLTLAQAPVKIKEINPPGNGQPQITSLFLSRPYQLPTYTNFSSADLLVRRCLYVLCAASVANPASAVKLNGRRVPNEKGIACSGYLTSRPLRRQHYLPREGIRRSLFQETSNIATMYTRNDNVAPVDVIMDAVAHCVLQYIYSSSASC